MGCIEWSIIVALSERWEVSRMEDGGRKIMDDGVGAGRWW